MKRIIAILAALASLGMTTVTSVSSEEATPQPQDPCTTPLAVQAVYGLDSSGNQVAPGTYGAGLVRDYGNGLTLTTPPEGFIPANATKEELDLYRIPDELRSYDKPLVGEDSAQLCPTDFQNATAKNSSIWAGRVLEYSTYRFTDVKAAPDLPSYDSYCDTIDQPKSEASIWVGIGGFDTNKAR
ncbi:MAG: hypothetical protein ACXVEX_11670 [Actinomycetota bacterium]